MTLFFPLCVCLLLTCLALRHRIRTTLEDTRLHLFGKRVRVPARPHRSGLDRPAAQASRHRVWPPFRVSTRPGP